MPSPILRKIRSAIARLATRAVRTPKLQIIVNEMQIAEPGHFYRSIY